jgi:hypothetical protein
MTQLVKPAGADRPLVRPRNTELLDDLFAYLYSVDQMSPREFERGPIVDDMALDMENRVAALQKAITFTSGHDLLHTNLTHDRIQNAAINFQRTWRNVAGGILMNKALTGALHALDQTIIAARQKIDLMQLDRPSNYFSSDNVFQHEASGQQRNQNVSNQNGRGRDQKGGKNGKNSNKDKPNKNSTDNSQKGQNGNNNNSVKKTGNQFQPSGVAAAFKALGMIGNSASGPHNGKAQKGKGRGKKSGRWGR